MSGLVQRPKLKLIAYWSPACETWVLVEGENQTGAPCPEWLTENAPEAWVEQLVREAFDVDEDDVIVVSTEPWTGKVR